MVLGKITDGGASGPSADNVIAQYIEHNTVESIELCN